MLDLTGVLDSSRRPESQQQAIAAVEPRLRYWACSWVWRVVLSEIVVPVANVRVVDHPPAQKEYTAEPWATDSAA